MTAVHKCDYPLFRDAFLLQSGDGAAIATAESAVGRVEGRGPRRLPGSGLKVLDLRSLPRDDGPPTELRARKDKLAMFDRHCTRVAEGLFVAGETVAKSRELLRGSAITHVVNCVGFLYPAYFEDELAYKVLYLQDTPGEDILCVLYDVFDFIEAAAGGNVLVHCSQGVSRSTALAIAYLMWKTGRSYDEVFVQVKAHRGVANPNIGFICQLLQWHKRRHSAAEPCRMYRMAPQSASVPRYLVPKLVSSPQLGSLDPRGAFVVQSEAAVYVWEGAQCPEDFAAAAMRSAQQLVKYEGAQGPPVAVAQGREPLAFWDCLGSSAEDGGSGGAGPSSPRENPSFDKDFELYRQAVGGGGGGNGAGEAGDSARGGRKTPRDEGREQSHSPNERLRKQARGSGGSGDDVGDAVIPLAAAARSRCLGDVSIQELERGISLDSAAMQLEVREQRVTPSRLQRATSEEVSLPSLQRSPPAQGGGGSECADEADSGSSGGDGAQPAPKPAAARPAVPPISLKLKLPAR